MLKKAISGLICAVLSIGLMGCGDTSKPVKDTQVKQEVKKEKPKNENFKVGDAIKLNGTVLTVESCTLQPAGEYDSIKQGSEYAIVKVKIENKGDETISYNPFYFKIKNSKGQITECTYTGVIAKTQLKSGELAKGGVVDGTLAFEVPKEDKDLQLFFQDDIFTNGAKITINLNK